MEPGNDGWVGVPCGDIWFVAQAATAARPPCAPHADGTLTIEESRDVCLVGLWEVQQLGTVTRRRQPQFARMLPPLVMHGAQIPRCASPVHPSIRHCRRVGRVGQAMRYKRAHSLHRAASSLFSRRSAMKSLRCLTTPHLLHSFMSLGISGNAIIVPSLFTPKRARSHVLFTDPATAVRQVAAHEHSACADYPYIVARLY